MSWLEALVLGIIQGLTEFLPVSSSGHIEIGKYLLGVDQLADDVGFTVLVHTATVLSTLIVFRNVIGKLFSQGLTFKDKATTHYVFKLVVSMIPVAFVGLFLHDFVAKLFGTGSLFGVGLALLVTALLLTFAHFSGKGKREITYLDAFVIGLGQALAVVPGLSRSGTTIATGILLGNKRSEVAQFSFLMVMVPILGESFLQILESGNALWAIGLVPAIVGFLAAFFSGLFACKVMLKIVQNGKLIYFAIYCAIVALCAILC